MSRQDSGDDNANHQGMSQIHPEHPGGTIEPTQPGHDSREGSDFNYIPISTMSSSPISAAPANQHHATSTAPELVPDYEGNPLPDTDGIQTRNAALARRQSTMSRLGTRILPNYVVRGLFSSGEETAAEGLALRTGHHPRPLGRSETAQGNRRFSPFRSLGSRGITRRRSARGPYPLPDSPHPSYLDPLSGDRPSNHSRQSWRQRARLSRVRNSISTPLSQMFGQPAERTLPQPPPMPPPERPSRSEFPPDPDPILPPLGGMDTRMDFEGTPHELDSVEPEMRPPRSISPGSSRPSQVTNGIRRLPNALRARSSRLLRRDDHTPLSRVLQLAAAAIAAQLSGGAGPPMGNVQALGADGLDGSLDSLIRSLNNSQTLQGGAGRTDGENNTTAGDGSSPPVNFLRVFRFVNPDSPRPNSADPSRTSTESERRNPRSDRMDIDDEQPQENDSGRGAQGRGVDGRVITLVVVGIRPVPSNVRSRDESGNDASSAAEDPLPASSADPPRTPGTPGGLFRRSDGRSRFSPHRHSMGSSNAFPSNYDSQRHQRSHTATRGQQETATSSRSRFSIHTGISDSPPGPFPPPSTPAEPGLSAQSSGSASPSRRPSSSSAMPPNILPQLNEDPTRNTEAQPTVESSFNTARQRRRSDSEFARRRDLGSGAARRNGVVEADNGPSPTGRSWLIYVVGTNISENHPAFAAPSLFTDVNLGLKYTPHSSDLY